MPCRLDGEGGRGRPRKTRTPLPAVSTADQGIECDPRIRSEEHRGLPGGLTGVVVAGLYATRGPAVKPP